MRIAYATLVALLLTACAPAVTPANTAVARVASATPPTLTPPPPTGDLAWLSWTSVEPSFSLNYPPDWSVREAAQGATFTSPHGHSVQLMTAALAPEAEPLPNTRCSSIVNAAGLAIETCRDTLSSALFAHFSLADHTVWLTMGKPIDEGLFNHMLESIRAGP